VTLEGSNLSSLGTEPQSKANIYNLTGATYDVKISGTGALRTAKPAEAPAADAGAGETADNGPQIEQILPKVNENYKLILGLALSILAFGFILLYRAPEAPLSAGRKETNERGRR
jgi:hypothetical protein